MEWTPQKSFGILNFSEMKYFSGLPVVRNGSTFNKVYANNAYYIPLPPAYPAWTITPIYYIDHDAYSKLVLA